MIQKEKPIFVGLVFLMTSAIPLEAMKDGIQEALFSSKNKTEYIEPDLSELEINNTISTKSPQVSSNDFNPSIGLILNGKYSNFSKETSDIKGVGTPEEGARGEEGFKLGESELTLSANADDKFKGSLTVSFVNEDGGDGVEIEEAFIMTLPSVNLPTGMTLKAGRAFWTIGYLNEQHAHTDYFVDRPLPYRMFLNNAYNDDGIEVTYVLPTDLYSEIGGGLYRGDDYPFGSASGSGKGAWSLFARLGGDFRENHSWRFGCYVLSGDTAGRASNEDMLNFIGKTNLYAADLRYSWAPTGNPYEKEFLFQAEYFCRDENGTYEDMDADTGMVVFDDRSSGWYAQGVYKFRPQWRVGCRYSQLRAPDAPSDLAGSLMDSSGFNPVAYAVMVDWSNSEFSQLRLQYNHEKLEKEQVDNQFFFQYIVSFGAHSAHKY